jgi:hypothetical protein
LVLPLAVVSTTLALPTEPAGVVQITEVSVLDLGEAQATPPTVRPVTLRKLLPKMVMLVPPAVLPLLGVMLLMVGPA